MLNAEKQEGLVCEVTWWRSLQWVWAGSAVACPAHAIYTVRPEVQKHRAIHVLYSHLGNQLLWQDKVIPTNHHCLSDGLYESVLLTTTAEVVACKCAKSSLQTMVVKW